MAFEKNKGLTISCDNFTLYLRLLYNVQTALYAFFSYSAFFSKGKNTNHYSWLLFKIDEAFWVTQTGFFCTK